MKRTETRYHHTLSDGSHLGIYLKCDKNVVFEDGFEYDVWNCGAAIGPTRKSCNVWWAKGKSPLNNKSTGRVGLEGLLLIKKTIEGFMALRSTEAAQILVVGAADIQRYAVYKRLCRAYKYWEGTYYGDSVLFIVF